MPHSMAGAASPPAPSRSAADATRGENMNARKARRIAIRILDEFDEMVDVKNVTVPSSNREGIDEGPGLPDR